MLTEYKPESCHPQWNMLHGLLHYIAKRAALSHTMLKSNGSFISRDLPRSICHISECKAEKGENSDLSSTIIFLPSFFLLSLSRRYKNFSETLLKLCQLIDAWEHDEEDRCRIDDPAVLMTWKIFVTVVVITRSGRIAGENSGGIIYHHCADSTSQRERLGRKARTWPEWFYVKKKKKNNRLSGTCWRIELGRWQTRRPQTNDDERWMTRKKSKQESDVWPAAAPLKSWESWFDWERMLGRTRKKPGTPGNPLVAPLTVISPKPPPIFFPRILSFMSTPFRLIKPSFIDHSRLLSWRRCAHLRRTLRCSLLLLAAASGVPRLILARHLLLFINVRISYHKR